ncbi:MAG TPA: tetratricopeptide repeat protein [Acidobacteriota bacterium]|nr:tetratricopeptide repeat protein [Acidobacteriota bacterium]
MFRAYLGTLAAWVLAALLPDLRAWGLDSFRFAPWPVAAGAALVAVAPFLARFAPEPRTALRDTTFFVGTCLAATAAFVLGAARGHFLGDGYQNLGLLAAERPFLKNTAPLTLLLLAKLKELLGGDPERAALLAYRIVSIGSGVAFLAVVWTFSGRLFETSRARRLFLLGLATGGWSLQFFGYVENYALFIATVAAYALAGAAAARHRGPYAPAILLAILATAFHSLGLVLAPSLLFLLRDTRLGRAMTPRARPVRVAIAAVALAAGGAVAYLSRNLAARLAFVPPTPWRLVPDDYAWFAPEHLLDLANLALLLVPGAAVLVVAGARDARTALAKDRAAKFLAALAASAAFGAFVLDPKLGMARDWDLFAFAGVPAAALGYYVLLSRGPRGGEAPARAATLAILLGLLALVPRVVTNAREDLAYVRFRAHLEIDPGRGRAARYHVVHYLQRIGAEDLAMAETLRWDRDYPERRIGREAMAARDRGDLDLAIRLNEQALALSPSYSDAWNNLGGCRMVRGEWGAAKVAFETALALNPNEIGIQLNLGTLAFRQGDLDGAERWWRRVWNRDPENELANRFLARLAAERSRQAGGPGPVPAVTLPADRADSAGTSGRP